MTLNLTVETDKQVLFDRAVRKLHAQGGKAESNNMCSYRTPNGRACGIGSMLSKDVIDYLVEWGLNGSSIVNLVQRESTKTIFAPWKDDEFFRRMQCAHDGAMTNDDQRLGKSSEENLWVDVWCRDGIARNLEAAANAFNLNPAVIYEIFGPSTLTER